MTTNVIRGKFAFDGGQRQRPQRNLIVKGGFVVCTQSFWKVIKGKYQL